jgi:hypothetical protein
VGRRRQRHAESVVLLGRGKRAWHPVRQVAFAGGRRLVSGDVGLPSALTESHRHFDNRSPRLEPSVYFPGAGALDGSHRLGGGYTNLAMVPETQAMTHPANTRRTVCVLSLLPCAATTAKRTPQTTKQPKLNIQ